MDITEEDEHTCPKEGATRAPASVCTPGPRSPPPLRRAFHSRASPLCKFFEGHGALPAWHKASHQPRGPLSETLTAPRLSLPERDASEEAPQGHASE